MAGPYKREWREHWLKCVLEAQKEIRTLGPPEVANLALISMDELREIRKIWLHEKHEFQDSLPRIYFEATGEEFPLPATDDAALAQEDWEILEQICGDDADFFTLQTELLDIERQFRGMSRRAGIYDAIEDRLKARQFASEEEAVRIRSAEKARLDAIGKATGQGGEMESDELLEQRTLFADEAEEDLVV